MTCHTCRSPDTILQKDTRLFFLQCEACGSRCSVASIKSGFQVCAECKKGCNLIDFNLFFRRLHQNVQQYERKQLKDILLFASRLYNIYYTIGIANCMIIKTWMFFGRCFYLKYSQLHHIVNNTANKRNISETGLHFIILYAKHNNYNLKSFNLLHVQ